MKRVLQNGVVFEINENDFTAKVVKSPAAANSVFIPRAIYYESKEYIVIEIDESAFQSNQNISSVFFEDKSEVKKIAKNVFSASNIVHFSIPANLKFIEEGWCRSTNSLIDIDISSQNQYFQLINGSLVIMSTDDNEKVLIFASRNTNDCEIPSYVTKIASYSFENTTSLYSLSFPDDSKLRSISQKAFQFSKIKKFTIPSTLQYLEEGWCSYMDYLTDIEVSPKNVFFEYLDNKYLIRKGQNDEETILLFVNRNIIDSIIPSCVTRIGSFSFANCKELKSISFNKNTKIKAISKDAFSGSKLQDLSIPASLEYLDDGWCNSLSSLKNISVSPKNSHFMFIDNSYLIHHDEMNGDKKVLILARRDITHAKIPSFVTHIANEAFKDCYDLNDVLFTSDSSLIEIGDNSFANCLSLTNISMIPKKVKRIGKAAFQYCEILGSITFDQSNECELEIIDDEAFDSCTNLEKVSVIPKHVKRIGDYAFGACQSLSSISFQEGAEIEYIDNDAFNYTSIINIPVPANVKGLKEKFTMSHNSAYQFEISPDNKFNEYFENEFLISKLEDDVVLVYANSDIEEALIPSNVTRIGIYSFQMCDKLNSVSFKSDSNLKSIGENAFSYSSLKSLELPDSLEIIEDGWCFSLVDLIDIKVSPKNENFRLFGDGLLIRKNFYNSFLSGDDIIFALRNIETATIPSFISRIGMHAFAFCSNLKSIAFEETSALKEFCSSSFVDCKKLESIVSIPASLRFVGCFCFSRSVNLTSLEFLSDELEFHYGSFYECSSVAILSFPNGRHIKLGFNMFLNVKNEIIIYISNNGEIIRQKN